MMLCVVKPVIRKARIWLWKSIVKWISACSTVSYGMKVRHTWSACRIHVHRLLSNYSRKQANVKRHYSTHVIAASPYHAVYETPFSFSQWYHLYKQSKLDSSQWCLPYTYIIKLLYSRLSCCITPLTGFSGILCFPLSCITITNIITAVDYSSGCKRA